MPRLRDATSSFVSTHDVDPRPVPTAAIRSLPPTADRIGTIIAERLHLSPEQMSLVLRHHRDTGARVGEAAVAMGFAGSHDVAFALSRQFHYPYTHDAAPHHSAELVVLNDPFGPPAEQVRSLRSQLSLRLFNASEPRRALAVISPQSGDGRSYCAANLAVALAQLGGRTLLVDGDLRRPRQHEIFKLGSGSGLSNVLAGRADAGVIQPVEGVEGLHVLVAGAPAPNPLELVERASFASLMRELAQQFAHVVVDTPAAEHGADAAVIAAGCGAALLVARRHTSRMTGLQALMESFACRPVHAVGFVLNEF
jgi:chain length determinant protein tyrosine kinase EpsG